MNSKRVAYALRNGLGTGLVLFVLMGLFKLGKSSFAAVYTSPAALRQLGYFLLGAVLGYYFFGWWANQSRKS